MTFDRHDPSCFRKSWTSKQAVEEHNDSEAMQSGPAKRKETLEEYQA